MAAGTNRCRFRVIRACAGLLGMASCIPLAAAQSVQSPISSSRIDAPYLLADGSVQIIASSSMAEPVRSLNTLYSAAHPETRFTVVIGDNYSAMAALTFNRSLVAPMGCEYTRIGLGDNLKIAADPLPIRLAHATLRPGAGTPALGVIVNNANPLDSLSMAQLMRVFTVGAPSGDIALWDQAGVTGRLAQRQVIPFGPLPSDYTDSDDPQAGEFLSTDKFVGLNMNHAYQGLPHYADVVQRVSEDPAAIGIIALNTPHANVKVLALRQSDTAQAVLPTGEAIGQGAYPLDRFVYLYLRVGKGAPLDPLAVAYARFALSDKGQQAIASAGYLPLNAAELAEERAKLMQ
jgi:phosphate transport system substrate-binding protein